MFCGKCGANNDVAAQFCASCGEQLTDARPGGTAPDNRSRNHAIGIVVTVVVLLAVVVGVFLLINKGSKSYERQLVEDGVWFTDSFIIEFCEDGKCFTTYMDYDESGTWSIENGDTIKLTDGEDNETWRIMGIEDGVLTFYDDDGGWVERLYNSLYSTRKYPECT